MTTVHLHYLDGWRGLAVILLLVGHFFPVPGINLGAVGVSLFFVLSGLLMARLLFVRRVPLPLFYRRRIARIFPTALVFVVVWTVACLVTGQRVLWAEVAAAVLFVNNYFLGETGGGGMPFQHFWSLCVEEHAYVLLSLVAVAARQKWVRPQAALAAAVAMVAAIIIYYCARYSDPELFERWRHTEVSAYGILVSACLLLYCERHPVGSVTWLTVPALLVFGLVMHWWIVPQPLRTFLGVGAFALAVNLLGGAPKLIQAGFAWLPLRQCGIWSYSLYIWQQPFHVYVQHQRMVPEMGLALAVGCGICSFYLLEQPARTYLNRRWGRASASAAPAAPHSTRV